jgi:arylsulfatase A-like enzyme
MTSRRAFLGAIGGLATAALIHRTARAAEQRPLNFVFILNDDLGWRDVGAYGHRWHETPNIDRLAAQGMRFTQAYAACPVCSPTRASLLTGKYPARLRLTDFLVGKRWPADSPLVPVDWTKHLPLEEVTIPELLKTLGYATAHIGKWHLGPMPQYEPEKQGFDVNVAGGHWGSPPSWFSPYKNSKLPDGPKGEYLVERLAAEADHFIRANKDRPFYLQLWDYNVHIPLGSKQELIDKYRNKPVPPGEPGPHNPVYAAMCEAMDNSVGRVMRTLDELGIADRTAVIFSSDNGGLSVKEGGSIPTTNLPLRDGKGYLHEGGIRVPLIVRCPSLIKPAGTCDVPVTSPDLMPTLWELAGGDPAKLPRPQDGLSIASLLKGANSPDRDAIYWHYPHYSNQGGPPGSAMRLGDYKYIRNYADNSIELYDLKADPSEATNLTEKRPEVASEIARRMDRWLDDVKALIPRRK